MLSVSVSIDVPDTERGARFYKEAFGFSTVAEPYPGVVVMKAGGMTITLLEKREDTKPSPDARDVRHYDRHWTPVHLDFHVDDLATALERALKAGARKEQQFDHPDHGSAAFCADPFGHGFCLLERRPDGGK
jgi:predicted enzyme related to lactoylglutathione lyase